VVIRYAGRANWASMEGLITTLLTELKTIGWLPILASVLYIARVYAYGYKKGWEKGFQDGLAMALKARAAHAGKPHSRAGRTQRNGKR